MKTEPTYMGKPAPTGQECSPTPKQPAPTLCFQEFWPHGLNTEAETLEDQTFERFDVLLPRANAWLRENPEIGLVKVETSERKIWSLDQTHSLLVRFDVPGNVEKVYYLKGLRIWYLSHRQGKRRSHPYQIGYRNFTPRCTDASHKHPVFEDLGPLYNVLNESLIDKPLEGEIVSMETVCVKLDRNQFNGTVDADTSLFHMSSKYHTFFFSRIFYLFEFPAYEQVGAADFLPDFVEASQKSGLPKYTGLPSIMKKLNAWLKQVKDIRVVNIQSLEAAFPGKADKVRTNTNFISKSDTMPMIRFLRVAYARPKFGLPPGGLQAATVVSPKTFLPAIARLDEKTNTPEFEEMNVMWERAQSWLSQLERTIVGMEILSHPLPLLLSKKDLGDGTILPGDWRLKQDLESCDSLLEPMPQIYIVRVYIEGDFSDSIVHALPTSDSQDNCKLPPIQE